MTNCCLIILLPIHPASHYFRDTSIDNNNLKTIKNQVMKTLNSSACVCTVAKFVFVVLLSIASAKGQILSYDFNTPGSTQTNTGTGGSAGNLLTRNAQGFATDFITAAGTGVSGQTGDRALDFTAGTANSPGPSAVGLTVTSLNGLNSFTIAGWAKNLTTTTSTGRILYNKSNSSSAATIDLAYRSNTGGRDLVLTVGGQTVISPQQQYAGFESSSWTFFAVTYNAFAGANGEAVFYSAGTAGALTANTRSFSLNPGATGTSGQLFVGNASSAGNRPFLGWLDELSFYGAADSSGALSSIELTSLRDAAVVPEPSTLVLFLVGAGVAVMCKSRRRRIAS